MRVLMAHCGGVTSARFAVVAHTPSPAFLLSQMSFTWRRSMVAFSKPPTTDEHGSRFLTISQSARSAPSRCRFPIRTSFTLAAAKVCIARICQSVMAFTNRRTREKRGRIWDCAMGSRFHKSRSIPGMLTEFLSRLAGILTGLTRSAGFSARSMAVRRSKKFSTATRTPEAATSRSIQRIPMSSTRRSGNREKARGKTAPGTEPTAASSNQPTAARAGTNSARVFLTKLCRQISQSRRVHPGLCSQQSKR